MKPDDGKCLSPPFAVRPRRGLVRTSRRGGSRKKFAEKVVINASWGLRGIPMGYLWGCAPLVGPPPRRRAWYPPCAGGSVTSTRGVPGFSEGGREHRRIGGVPYGMLLFCGARFTGRASARAARRRGGTTTFHTKHTRITHLGDTRPWNPYYNCRYGAGHATFPPSKERRPGLLPALKGF